MNSSALNSGKSTKSTKQSTVAPSTLCKKVKRVPIGHETSSSLQSSSSQLSSRAISTDIQARKSKQSISGKRVAGQSLAGQSIETINRSKSSSIVIRPKPLPERVRAYYDKRHSSNYSELEKKNRQKKKRDWQNKVGFEIRKRRHRHEQQRRREKQYLNYCKGLPLNHDLDSDSD